ncbi:hypothetical protein RAB80_000217 [Fusarium oxysporum f. sp. vasinfectum]|nr:hypothetical protein RAB80_000217 [Fusarium oxysporum f. sp. vasinfectum]
MFEDERGRKDEMEEKCEGRRDSPSNRAAPATSGLLPSATGNNDITLELTKETACATGKELQCSLMRCRLWGTTMPDERPLSTRSYDIPLHFPQYSFTGSVVNSPRLLGGGRKLLSFTKPHFDQHA